MKKIFLFILLFFSSSFFSTKADEGMWVLPLLNQQNISQMKGLGLDICAEDIYHPDSTSLKDAVVIFGRGCTGEVISPNGLILTNHHCGYSYIQQHSSVDNDLLTNGFWAKNREEERHIYRQNRRCNGLCSKRDKKRYVKTRTELFVCIIFEQSR